MPFVNKNTESVLIVAFYKKTLSTICSGIFEHSLSFKYYVIVRPCVSILCLENMVAWNTSFSPRNDSMTGLLPPMEKRQWRRRVFKQDQGSHHFNQIISKFWGLWGPWAGSEGYLWHIAAYSQNSFMYFYFIFKKKGHIKKFLRRNNAT